MNYIKLTPRELEVLELIEEGCRIRAIAERLNITRFCAKAHVSSIHKKFNISTLAEIAQKLKEAKQKYGMN